MPTLKTTFPGVRFSESTINLAFTEFARLAGATPIRESEWLTAEARPAAWMTYFKVDAGERAWTYDNADEFFTDLRQPYDIATVDFRMSRTASKYDNPLKVDIINYSQRAVVTVVGEERATVLAMMGVFDRSAPDNLLPVEEQTSSEVEQPRVFIGHGRDQAWRDLKDHLTDHHQYEVVAYETGTRSGHTIRDVLDTMLDQSTFAILVMTAEDDQPDGTMRARQNVVHEAGLFQGRLGFPRVAIPVQEGVELFSNIDGVQYIPFGAGGVRETYGDVLAMLRREFGPGY